MSIREEQKKKLGFGTMRLPVKRDGSIDYETYCAMADRFIAKGFRYFDTAYPYHDGQSEIALRECVVKRHKREEFTVADKMPQWSLKTSEDLERIFNGLTAAEKRKFSGATVLFTGGAGFLGH